MSFRTILGVFSTLALISSCTFPLSPRVDARVAFQMTIPSMPASSSASGSRLIAAETSQVRITVTTEGAVDEVFNFTPVVETVSGVQIVRIEVTVMPGLHTFLIQTLDSDARVLTTGEVTTILAEGPNQLTVTLEPSSLLAVGDTPSLEAGQVAYFTLPSSLGVVLRVSGTDSTFWECTAAGSFSGAGSSGSFDLDLTGASNKVLRVVQGAAGGFSVAQAQVSPVTFSLAGGTYSADQTISLSVSTPGASIQYSIDGGAAQNYTTAIAVAGHGTTRIISATATAAGYLPADSVANTYVINYSQTSTVAFSVANGTYTTDQSIVLTNTTPGAVIQYSLNGGAYQPYTGPISVAGDGTTATIAARATAPGFSLSTVATNTYIIAYPQASAVVFSVAGGAYTSDQSIVLTNTTPGAVIQYSLSGGAYQSYTGAISVAGNGTTATIAARATATGFATSAIVTNTYTISYLQTSSVSFSLAGGTYSSDQSIVLTNTTLGAVIEYSLNAGAYQPYMGAISVAGNGTTATIAARATAAGFTTSAIVTNTYTINYSQTSSVAFSVAGGTYTSDQSIVLTNTTPGAVIQYSLNGGAYQPYAGAISVAGNGTTATIAARATAAGFATSAIVTNTYTINYSQTSSVAFSVAGGTYSADQSIVLTNTTPGAVIEYSLNAGAYQPYTGAISVAGNGTTATIAARATAAGFTMSAVVTNSYTISYLQTSSVAFSVAGGTFTSDQSIVLTNTTPGAVIQYSLNGGAYQSYTGPISVAGNGTTATIAARATAAGFTMSAVVTNSYTISYLQTSSVAFSVAGGTYSADQSIVLTNTTPGAVIEYSLNAGAYQPYTGAISVAGNGTTATIAARATAAGFATSAVVTNTYTINSSQTSSVTFSVAGGTYTADQSIVLTDATPGAVIEYSFNGGAYQSYTGPISVAGNGTTATIDARATAPGFTISAVTTNTYVIQYSGVTIDFTLPTQPVVLGANNLTLNATLSETLTVALDSPAAFTTYTWYIDGTTGTYQMAAGWVYNGQAFTYNANSLVVESQYMTTGLHEVLVIVQDGSGTYSAQFNVEVLR